MPGLTAVAEMILGIGFAAKASTAEVREARTEVQNYAREKRTTAGMTGGDTSSTTLGATSLGDPRDATEQAARMVAAIQNATGR